MKSASPHRETSATRETSAAHGAAARRLLLPAAALAAVVSAPAFAQQRQGGDNCAIYGAGFVAVQGSSTCVRIGGRVRLDMNAQTHMHAFAPAGGGSAAGAFPGAARSGGEGVNRARMSVGGRR